MTHGFAVDPSLESNLVLVLTLPLDPSCFHGFRKFAFSNASCAATAWNAEPEKEDTVGLVQLLTESFLPVARDKSIYRNWCIPSAPRACNRLVYNP
jgi:hypothetical protein